MKNFGILSFIIIVCSLNSIAQNYEFRVLANKGSNHYRSSSNSEWQPLKTGSTLFAGMDVKVESGAYIGLMHKSGKTFELRTAGEYKTDDLSKKIITGSSSVASKYGEYLLAKMNNSDEDVSQSKLNNLKVTGAVSRAADDAAISLLLPKTSKILSMEDTKIKWNNGDMDLKGYNFQITNLFEETIVEKNLNNNIFDLSTANINIEEQGGLFLKVNASDNPKVTSSMHAIEILSGDAGKQLRNNLENLKSEISSDDVSLRKLILAIFYEENGLFLHAFSCYHEVLTDYPEVDFYKSAYLGFVERNKSNF